MKQLIFILGVIIYILSGSVLSAQTSPSSSPLPTPVNIIQKFGPQDSQESALKVSGTVTVIPVNSYGYRLDILNMVDSTNSAYFNSLGQRGYELVAILPYRGNIAPATSSPFLVVWKKHN